MILNDQTIDLVEATPARPADPVRVGQQDIRKGRFHVEFPVAGRYRVEIFAEGDATLRVIDHVDNTHNREYDITSKIPLDSLDTFSVVGKDGAPLNAGPHTMELRIEEGSALIESIQFILMQEHERTPITFQQPYVGQAWKLVWADEFEVDGLPNPDFWTYDVGNWGWGNNEPQYYTANRLENARCEGGRLIVEARRDGADGGWTSARLTTRGRLGLRYGRLETRVKTTGGDGCWPAFWLLGDSYRDELSWPYCGEIDLFECSGRDVNKDTGEGLVRFGCHTGAYYFKNNNHISAEKSVPDYLSGFHDYALEWTPEAISLYFDGELVYTYGETADEVEFPFNEPQNIIINLAMGGILGGAIDPALTRERMEVEHIRLFGRDGSLA